MKLYGIPNCNTVKKARDWLDQHAIQYEFHDFKKLGLDTATAQSWLQQQPWEKLINRSGMTWRNLSDAEKNAVIDAASAQTLMQEKTSVIKRPIVMKDHQIITIGFKEADYVQLFAKE
ncbi:ArsC family reductase [Methylophilus medardicus]|uniref:ArsC family reductase n=1 Tax=Methylophilus medardicus TaxID=2588534 RepID=A0A5B8CRN6_9PROT|nr:ArsC family reductase [Methylophilus medardicus]QDC43770.1 ArsC family reductase [Methylophilus medardicus]QDC48777.1 ArsC family reductase [Methylophilus medardicus]QDC52482.1 ArsC family reductase [Methylophilus medardicus]